MVQPNQYELKGQGLTVSYSTSSIAGKPQLAFKKGRQTLNFSGDQIETASTALGTLVSVTIAATADRGSTAFSFLVPAINLSSAKQAFRTFGITTVTKTTIAGPVKGPQQTYKTIALAGSARQVQFLAEKTAAS